MKTGNKIAASVVSLLLVVGVVIGVVVMNNHQQKKEQAPPSTPTTSTKTVALFCEPTVHKDLCVKSMGDVAKNESATTKDYVLAAFKATIAELQSTKPKAGTIQVKDEYHANCVRDCPMWVDYALDALSESIDMIAKSDFKSVDNLVVEVINFLGGVNAFTTTCIDDFEDPELKKQIEDIMTSANQLVDNAFKIMAHTFQVLKTQNISIPDSIKLTGNRRLLALHGDASDGYPSWFPAADRELLQNVGGKVVPNAVVAKDGSGQFRAINDALKAMPKVYQGRYIIHVKAGIYEEKVSIEKDKHDVLIYGDGQRKTIVTRGDNRIWTHNQTWATATFSSVAPGVVIKSMTIRNTAGHAGHQAVALRVQGDTTVVFDCSLEGYQDTLLYHAFRQFYRNCVISGTVDFLFGHGAAFIQDSTLVVRNPGPGQANIITADGNEKEEAQLGLVIHNSKIVPELALIPVRHTVKTYLGRPWKQLATTMIMKCDLGDFIQPQGWLHWAGANFHETCNFGEFANVGPSAATNQRDKSFKRWRVLSPEEAELFTAKNFLNHSDHWLPASTVPFNRNM